ncbi:MAG: DEAD/DEAH box helicase [Maricaulaceae bacterium]
MTSFFDLNLSKPLNAALEHLGYTTPTPIQTQAIPIALKGQDIMGIAQTGTGKTAAFALPTLDHLVREERDPPKRGARILVLAPTRELASQIAVSYREYGRSIPTLRVCVIFGGVPIQRQIKKIVAGNDVIVATPGRLIDLIERKDVRLSEVEVLILDEADQMMDMGFIHALRKIVPILPKERQTLFFSATLSPQIKKLAAQFLTNPASVSVSPANSTADKVTQSVIYASGKEKPDLLALTLSDPDVERALIFTRTKHGADRVAKRLTAAGMPALAIHGNKSQNARQRALTAFKDGDIRLLVATDVAARGIDIGGITHVINYEIPNVPEQYVHRIGRTARANTSGRAIAFVADDERPYLKDIQKLLKVTIPVEPLPENFLKQVKDLKANPRFTDELPDYLKPGPKTSPKNGKGKRKKPKKTAEQLLREDSEDPQNEKGARPSRGRDGNRGGNRNNNRRNESRNNSGEQKSGGSKQGERHQGGQKSGGSKQGGHKRADNRGGSKPTGNRDGNRGGNKSGNRNTNRSGNPNRGPKKPHRKGGGGGRPQG